MLIEESIDLRSLKIKHLKRPSATGIDRRERESLNSDGATNTQRFFPHGIFFILVAQYL